MENAKTAILIFANSAQQEAFLKPFKSSVIDELNKETLKKVKSTGLPYFIISEKEQIGTSFAERFTNAVQSIYDKGFSTVISVGNDTPHLTTKKILTAANQLETDDVVLGPAMDGGFYLMGLKKSHFHKDTFLNLPWQTSQLSKRFFSVLNSQNLQFSLLEVLSDLDTVSDIKLIVQSKKSITSKLKKLLLASISEAEHLILYILSHFQNLFETNHFNKGSPILIHC